MSGVNVATLCINSHGLTVFQQVRNLLTPTMTGTLRFNPTIAAWDVSPPSSVITAPAFSNAGTISESVPIITRTLPASVFSNASAAERATTTLPLTILRPIPCPFATMSPITWIFIRLVVPTSRTGTPAVITTKSPWRTKPSLQ